MHVYANSKFAGGIAGLIFAAAVAMAAPALAQDQTGQPESADTGRYSDADVVVARVGQLEVRLSDIVGPAMAEYQKQGQKGTFEDFYNQVLIRRIERMLAANAAIDAGMQEDQIHAEQMKRLEQRLLSDRYMQQQIIRAVSEQAVREQYDAMVADLSGQDEVHARHIVTKTEEEAHALKAEIEAGADFVTVAKNQSYPGADTGGDLGYFTEGEILPAIGHAAFALEVGAVSEPVNTALGWHLVKVEDRRSIQIPPFEEVQNRIFRRLSSEARETVLGDLQSRYGVTLYNRDGTPMGAPEGDGSDRDDTGDSANPDAPAAASDGGQ